MLGFLEEPCCVYKWSLKWTVNSGDCPSCTEASRKLMSLIRSFHSGKIYEEERANHRTVETKPGLVSIVISGKSGWWPSNAAALSPSSG